MLLLMSVAVRMTMAMIVNFYGFNVLMFILTLKMQNIGESLIMVLKIVT